MTGRRILALTALLQLIKGGVLFDEFPMKEFFNVSDTSMYRVNSYDRWRCINIPIAPHCCDCDSDCWKFGTCCIDILWEHWRETPELDQYLNKYESILSQYKQPLACDKILPTSPSNHHEIEALHMVSSCPPSATKQDVELCYGALKMRAYEAVPVLGKDMYLYKNKYCAKCNGVKSFKYQDVEVKCVDDPNIQNNGILLIKGLYNLTKCIMSIKRTSSNMKYLRICQHQDLSGNCSDRDKKLCHIHQASTANGHKNYFCLKCSSQFNSSDPQELDCPTVVHKDLSKYTFRFEISSVGEKFLVTNYHQTFPIWDFLELPSSFTLSENEGFDQYLCSGKRRRCCECNKDCRMNQKCCVDLLWNQTNPVDIKTYKKQLIEKEEKTKDFVCLPVYPPAVGTKYTVVQRKLIRSCSLNSSKQDKNNCLLPPDSQSPSMVVPVFGSDGLLYANSFCAKCNFVSYKYVTLSLRCESSSLRKEDLSNNITDGTIGFDINEKFSMCELDIVGIAWNPNTCKANAKITTSMCSYNNPMYYLCKSYHGVIDNFSNFHCRSCDTKDPIETSDISYCDPNLEPITNPTTEYPNTTYPPIQPQISWSLTLSFTDDTANLKYISYHDISLSSNCGKGKHFDIIQSKCIDTYCPPNHVVSGLNCEPLEFPNKQLQTPVNRTYFVYVQFHNEPFNQTLLMNKTFYEYYDSKNFTIMRSQEPVNLTSLDKLIRNLHLCFNASHVDIFIGVGIQRSLITPEYGVDFSRFFHGNRLCATPVRIPSQKLAEGNTSTIIYHNKTINITDLSYWISFEGDKPIHHYSACDQFYLDRPCLRQLLPAIQITKSDNLKITHNTSNGVETIYKVDKYLPTGEGYYVCLNKTNLLLTITRNSNHQHEVLLDVEYYITIVGISISIACYVCIILTYFIFKDLRTIAGLSNCFMCLSLLIADAMALSSLKAVESSLTCSIVSIVMHWSLLAAFSWTLIIALDLVSRFGSFKVRHNENITKKMIFRSLGGFCMPAVVVAIAVAIDKSNTTEIGYGDAQICWRVNNLSARIGLYIAPTGLVTLIALSSLCFTIGKISKEKKSTEKYIDSEENTRLTLVKIAIKLCIILGLTEIFGYIQIPDPERNLERDFNLAFGFIYAVLRSFRGVMLWFVYVYTGSARNLYKKQFHKTVRKLSRKENGWATSSDSSPAILFTNTESTLSTSIQKIPLHEI